MKKENVNATVETTEDGGLRVRIELTDEKRKRIPVVGQDIYILEPYPVDDEADMEGYSTMSPKERPILAWSYTNVMAKTTALSDDGESVLVNGSLTVSLSEPTSKAIERAKKFVLTSEEEANEKFNTLMSVSLKEAERRLNEAINQRDYLASALKEKLH